MTRRWRDAKSTDGRFDRVDPLSLNSQLDRDEILVRDAAREFAETYLRPSVTADFDDDYSDPNLLRAMGQHGLIGVAFPEIYGCAGASYVAYGLVAREMERIDTGCRSLLNVQTSLVMYPIYRFGSNEQRSRYLPALARGELIGCFGLTEPAGGSDATAMKTVAVNIDGGYRVTGKKAWISNAPIADLFIVWARSEAHGGVIRGFLVEKGSRGLSTKKVRNKFAIRTSINGVVSLDNVHVGRDAILPAAIGLQAPLDCLKRARYEVSWGVLGAAKSCFTIALQHGLERKKFERTLAASQLFQKKLSDMAIDISLGLQASLRVGRLIDRHECALETISLVKRNNAAKALTIARQAREIIGGSCMSSGYEALRHMLNLEAVSTHGGSDDVHALVLGRAITGFSAF
ncbi:acyl-CoA dehydrogenase family protein [Sphingopyxis sp.]|uniref:acyl-CoA dehydrogenase family protein n=1 Tax=Sphingopyxis sp. TaxID=1908224 RepID=UPI003D6CD41C